MGSNARSCTASGCAAGSPSVWIYVRTCELATDRDINAYSRICADGNPDHRSRFEGHRYTGTHTSLCC